MTIGLIGRKLGMTRIFQEDGTAVPVSVIEAGPCRVVQVRDGGVQLGFGARRAQRTSKAQLGHAKKAGLDVAPQVLRVFTVNGEAPAPGAEVKVDIFAPGELVKVTGTTKGRGFQGVVHRYGFGGGPATHGNTRHRKPGSISPGTDPSRVIKGKAMPGQYGNTRHTQTHLRIEKIDAERNLIYIRGSIAGPTNGIVQIRKQG
jgi:large subunit ribosomal protein L3